jgi:feruloyl esterase
LAPGMLHCGGGPGPSAFDMQGAISAWVEAGRAPERVIAAKFIDDDPTKGVALSRPLCPFPSVASWNGRGDKARAESFVCTMPQKTP